MKKFWDKVNNYKRAIGIIVTIVGYILKQLPDFEPLSDPLIKTGLIVSGIGVSHFLKKERDKKKNGGVGV